MNMETMNNNANNEHYEALKVHQDKNIKGSDTQKDSLSLPIGCK